MWRGGKEKKNRKDSRKDHGKRIIQEDKTNDRNEVERETTELNRPPEQAKNKGERSLKRGHSRRRGKASGGSGR